MRYRYISDSHTHTDSSRDGVDPATMLCEQAASLGLYALTVTDHCECEVYEQEEYDRSVVQSYFEACKAQAVFRGRLRVYAGVELGQPLHDEEAAQTVLHACDFDFVLASVHALRGRQDFYFMEYTDEESAYQLLEEYFDELIRVTDWGHFDSLAHLTYPLRYMVGSGLTIDLSRFAPKIDVILSRLVAKGKALEINTSGLRQAIGKTLPDIDIVKRFHELGGKYITLGSDAHRWADVGAGIEEGLALAQKAGFDHFCVYEQREPHLLPIT